MGLITAGEVVPNHHLDRVAGVNETKRERLVHIFLEQLLTGQATPHTWQVFKNDCAIQFQLTEAAVVQ